ncbi:hypothetical protein [Cupriavidus taiwanensis]|uniref:hypothetical protein n=1 Tax=Cupriavidus taiwanensis TaxID=164546 RepID=UPI0011C05962|nr:hypothetical protein [Cupriavidus taiwanensis]
MMPIPWRRRQGARLGFVVKATAHGAGFSGKHGPLKGRNSGSAQATRPAQNPIPDCYGARQKMMLDVPVGGS